jgi:hypothetical protein
MTKWIGAAILALGIMVDGSTPIGAAAAAPPQAGLQKPHVTKAADLSARRRARHHPLYVDRLLYQPNYPTYYDRPYYYAPAPYVPFNFGYPLLPPPWW